MSHFSLIGRDFDVEPTLAEIDAHPELWGVRKGRCEGDSPHRETQDLWLRYADPTEIGTPGFSQRWHKSVWYPELEMFPSVRALVLEVRRAIGGSLLLGGVLMTRIPPGKRVYEHHDRGAWHAEFYDSKVWLVLRANDRCVNMVEGEEMVWKPGEAWQHDNQIVHAVRNGGDTERIVLIVCFRKNR